MSLKGLYYPNYTPGYGSRPRLQSTHPFRNLIAAGSNLNNHWSGASGHSGYGLESPDYDYHSGPSAHVPSGGSYSYHATADTGYGLPVHPPAKPAFGTGSGGKKGIFGGGGGKRGSSAISALTLLSFLFFINLLQGCIKDHMEAMNPTAMVMTSTVIRNRFNKMGEMNSREQSSTYTSNAANIVTQPADLLAAAGVQSSSVAETSKPSTNLQSPYSNNPTSYKKPVGQAISQPPSQYVPNSSEPDLTINYDTKPQYNPHKPDPYHHTSQTQQSLSHEYDNHTLIDQPMHYNYHHTEYYAQNSPQSTIQHHPIATKPYNDDSSFQDFYTPQKYGTSQQQQTQHYLQPSSYFNEGHHPWSSNLHASSAMSGPFRRASITAVSPKTKWITVPAKITDRTHFDRNIEDIDGDIEHHDDRDAFNTRSRFT